ncbi:MAG: hypothetical protein J6T10_06550 [Methanobrevibacter sp.]|nr:hypothetical protein [Methanobrevibacter sp.]
MTSEDKQKLRFYFEQIVMECGSYGFFVRNGFYIDGDSAYNDSETEYQLVLHEKRIDGTDKEYIFFRCFVETYDVDYKYNISFIKYNKENDCFNFVSDIPEGYIFAIWEDIDEEDVDFNFMKKWIDYNLNNIMKKNKLKNIQQKLNEISKDFV